MHPSETPETAHDEFKRASELAVQVFASVGEATEAVLDLLQDMLRMKSVFLTRTDLEKQVLRVVAVHNTDTRFRVPPGLELPLRMSP